MIALIALVGSVVVGGAFGVATATVESNDGDVMVVELEVEVIGSAESVVAHLNFDNEPEQVIALLDRGEGNFGITTELEPKNYVVVFESLGEDALVSDPVTLSDMGADLGPEPSSEAGDDEDEGLSDESSRFLWLAIALGAASLSVLAFWVLGGREDSDEVTEPGEDEAAAEEAEKVAVAEDDDQ